MLPSGSPEPAQRPQWAQIADDLEALSAGPTTEQVKLSEFLGVDLVGDLPAHVCAVVLRKALQGVVFDQMRDGAELPEALHDIEDELAITRRARLVTGTREEVSAWFAARYAVKTAQGLRELRPEPGDVVEFLGRPGDERVISSIGPDGRVYMKGRPPRRAWPNYLQIGIRPGAAGYAAVVREIDSRLRNSAVYTSTNFAKLDVLREYEIASTVPSAEAIRALEELLDSGERLEEPFQDLLTRYPALLAGATVVGGWSTYVIPKQKLGAELVTDFLVLTVNSLGLQWVAVELEAPRHSIVNKDASLSPPTRHGVKQVQDWREWLTHHIAYAHDEHHLHGLTNRVPGLVIIGRDDPQMTRSASRAQAEEAQRIAVHSWDWLLRHAQRLAADALHRSEFALALSAQSGRAVDTPRDRATDDDSSSPALAEEDDPWDLDSNLEDPF